MALSPKVVTSVLRFLKVAIPDSANVRRGNVLGAVRDLAASYVEQIKAMKSELRRLRRDNTLLAIEVERLSNELEAATQPATEPVVEIPEPVAPFETIEEPTADEAADFDDAANGTEPESDDEPADDNILLSE